MHIFTGQYRSVTVGRDKRLKAVADDELSPDEVLAAAFTTDRSFSATSIPDTLLVGSSEWTFSCHHSDGLAHEVHRLSSRLDTVESELASHKQDISVFAATVIRNVAAQTLLYAAQDQSVHPPNRRFQLLATSGSPQLTAYLAACPVPPSLDAFAAAADAVINRRNSTVHYGTLKALEKAVTDAAGLLHRHPALRTSCKQESFIIDTFEELKTAFQLT